MVLVWEGEERGAVVKKQGKPGYVIDNKMGG